MDAENVGVGSEDVISSLPDHVLCHILSFLSTKHGASMSVLPKRWRDLFVLVPNLHFDDWMFLHPQMGQRERDDILHCFMDFVDRVLVLQGGLPIKNFYLSCGEGIDPARINNWLHNVLERGVLDLGIHVSQVDEYLLPSDVFTSRTLVKLNIGFGCDLSWLPPDVCLPMLKTLTLGCVWFENDGLINRLLSGCTVLEELVIDDMALPAWDAFCSISSAPLKRLRTYYIGLPDCSPRKFSFDTPNLVYLEYSDLTNEFPSANLDALVEARLDLQLTEDQFLYARDINDHWVEDYDLDFIPSPPGDATNLSMGIGNVQILSLSAEALEVLTLFCEEMSVFKNLIHLSIKSDEAQGWRSLPLLLENSPNLETLVLKGILHYISNGCGDACTCIPRENVSHCLSSCPVQTIEIWWF